MKQLTSIFLLITLLSFYSSCGQTSKPEADKETTIKSISKDSIAFSETPHRLKTIVDKIAQINEVQEERVGIIGTESENYKNFKKLRRIATTEELIQLTDNKNATVACYAGWALADGAYPDLKTIFQKYILNDRQVGTFSGCIKSQVNISNELYHRYSNSVNGSERPSDIILLELDSIVIFSEKPDWLLLHRALDNRIYAEPYKTQISILAFEQGRREAIFYLCNWHKADYAEEIKIALIKYLNETDFKNTGTTDYYKTVEELFKFNDPEIKKIVVAKMKKDRHWETQEERFKYLLSGNHIYNIDSE